MGREQQADLTYDRLLDKVKSHETSVAEYWQEKESRQHSIASQQESPHPPMMFTLRKTTADTLPFPDLW